MNEHLGRVPVKQFDDQTKANDFWASAEDREDFHWNLRSVFKTSKRVGKAGAMPTRPCNGIAVSYRSPFRGHLFNHRAPLRGAVAGRGRKANPVQTTITDEFIGWFNIDGDFEGVAQEHK